MRKSHQCCITIAILFTILGYGGSSTKKAPDKKTIPSSRGLVLVLGGTGFIGSHIVESLLGAGYDVTVSHRGVWYWDAVKLKDKVTAITCDRDWPIRTGCTKLMRYIQGNKFDAVVDVSGFKYNPVRDSIAALRNRTKLYIYISSDSIYEVCNKTHTGPTKERDAVRPTSTEKVAEYSSFDEYGNDKFVAEYDVIRQRLRGGFPFVILRLPDVFGPRDTSPRWLTYQVWQKYASLLTTPVRIPRDKAELTSSYVYVKDVGRVIMDLLKANSSVYNTVYNVAFEETNMTVVGLLRVMADSIGLADPQFTLVEPGIDRAPGLDDDADAPALYPSVTKGSLDTSKIRRVLNFKPTPLKQAVKETVTYFNDVIESGQYRQELLLIRGALEKFKIVAGPMRYKMLIQELGLLDWI